MMEIVKNKEEVKSVMNIIQAFANGKTIQAIDPYEDEWVDQAGLNFKALFEGQYRIKPEHTYRQFKDAEECWKEMLKHHPFGWLKGDKCFYNIVSVSNIDVSMANVSGDIVILNFSDVMEDNTFADGFPFGVKVEEQYGVLFV